MQNNITPIHNILIANRGEIASRIIRTCRKLGIRSIAVFSEADRSALFVQQADDAVFLGSSAPAESYMNADKIVEAALKTGADAIHPGYGFLSENISFAKLCVEKGLRFIGPNPAAIAAMGSKSQAKALMKKHGVPIVPGYQGEDQRLEQLKEEALKMGFPVLVKAAAGGGGKGMRIVRKEGEIEGEIAAAKSEALYAFGDDELIIEKYIESGRHIEFQIFGDQHGNVIHLLERECTIQRRYQKIIEESPSPVMTPVLREQMGTAAVKAAKAIHYDNAGTVEFIYDDQSGEFYFLEVNTRLQVEHPVTEEITGLDLIQLQIEVSEGNILNIRQNDIIGKGYAVEARLYAEDPENNYTPATGRILHFELPEVDELRLETAVEAGSEVTVFYDPMIAKIILWDQSRAGAHRKMQYVLSHLLCLGLKTNQDLLLRLFKNDLFRQGKYDTHFLQNHPHLSQSKENDKSLDSLSAVAASLYNWQIRQQRRVLLRSLPSGWRNNFYEHQRDIWIQGEQELEIKYRFKKAVFEFLMNEKTFEVQLLHASHERILFETEGRQYRFAVAVSGLNYYLHQASVGNVHLILKDRFPLKVKEKLAGGYEAPMPSQVIKILVKPGQKVSAGDDLIVLSSMKMENTISAENDGLVEEIFAEENKNVEAGFLLLKIKEKEATP